MIEPSTQADLYEMRTHLASGVNWGSIFAGAAGAAALSLLLLLLGAGLGLFAQTPWAGDGMTARGLGVSAVLWLAFTQIIASGIGGYIAGRLRVKWTRLRSTAVFFRDAAHGFLAWAVATVLAAVLLLTAASQWFEAGFAAHARDLRAAAATAARSAERLERGDPEGGLGYYVDALLRDAQSSPTADALTQDVVRRLLAYNLGHGCDLDGADRAWLAQLISQRTSLDDREAIARVDAVYERARQARADAQRKALDLSVAARQILGWTALWLFVSLLAGSVFGAFTATLGGRRRDALSNHDDG